MSGRVNNYERLRAYNELIVNAVRSGRRVTYNALCALAEAEFRAGRLPSPSATISTEIRMAFVRLRDLGRIRYAGTQWVLGPREAA